MGSGTFGRHFMHMIKIERRYVEAMINWSLMFIDSIVGHSIENNNKRSLSYMNKVTSLANELSTSW